MHARPEYEGAGSDVDWEGEWRWHDAQWVPPAIMMAGAGAVSLVLWWLSGTLAGVRLLPVVLVLTALLSWLNSTVMKRLMTRTGLTYRQLAVVNRLAKQERIPHDPVARRGMAHLVKFQNSKAAGRGWARPLAAVAVLVAAALQLASGNVAVCVVLVLASGYLASKSGTVGRLQARLARMEARLAPEFGPPADPAARPVA